MVKVDIKNKLGEVKWSGTKETLAELEQWVSECKSNNSWGRPERWLFDDDVLKDGLNIADSIQTKIVHSPEGAKTMFLFPDEYTVGPIFDITNEVSAHKALELRKKKRLFGENLIDKIGLINESKGITSTQVDAFMAVPIVITLREHLWAGNIPTFVEKLQTSDVSAFFTDAEKAAVIAECQAFIVSIGG